MICLDIGRLIVAFIAGQKTYNIQHYLVNILAYYRQVKNIYQIVLRVLTSHTPQTRHTQSSEQENIIFGGLLIYIVAHVSRPNDSRRKMCMYTNSHSICDLEFLHLFTLLHTFPDLTIVGGKCVQPMHVIKLV